MEEAWGRRWENFLKWEWSSKKQKKKCADLQNSPNRMRVSCSHLRIWLRSVFFFSDFNLIEGSFPKERGIVSAGNGGLEMGIGEGSQEGEKIVEDKLEVSMGSSR